MIPKETILARVQSLPTRFDTVARLSALLRDERSTGSDFERVIKPDPALTANLLRMVNSAYFGCRQEVASVRQAVALLGTKRLFEVATTAAFSRVLPDRLPGYEVSASAFWLHSIAVAVLAEHLGKELGFKTPELTFTSGLLHDVGKLVIGSFLSEESDGILARVHEDGLAFIAAEDEALGTNHAEIGGEIIRRWGLPDPIPNVCRWHHWPNEQSAQSDGRIIDLVHAADGLAHTLGYGTDVGELARRIESEVVERLGVKVQRLETVALDTYDQIREMEKLFVRKTGGNSS